MNHRQAKKYAKNKGQIVAEYSILIGIIVAALIVMNIYIKRGMQARLKDAVDVQMATIGGISRADTKFKTSQYEPGDLFVSMEKNTHIDENEAMAPGGALNTSRTITGFWSGEDNRWFTGKRYKDRNQGSEQGSNQGAPNP